MQKPVRPDRSFAELFVCHCTKHVERSWLGPKPHRASHTASNPDAGLAHEKFLTNEKDSKKRVEVKRKSSILNLLARLVETPLSEGQYFGISLKHLNQFETLSVFKNNIFSCDFNLVTSAGLLRAPDLSPEVIFSILWRAIVPFFLWYCLCCTR